MGTGTIALLLQRNQCRGPYVEHVPKIRLGLGHTVEKHTTARTIWTSSHTSNPKLTVLLHPLSLRTFWRFPLHACRNSPSRARRCQDKSVSRWNKLQQSLSHHLTVSGQVSSDAKISANINIIRWRPENFDSRFQMALRLVLSSDNK